MTVRCIRLEIAIEACHGLVRGFYSKVEELFNKTPKTAQKEREEFGR